MILRLSFAHPSVVVRTGETSGTGETGGTSGTGETGGTSGTSETSGTGGTGGISRSRYISKVLNKLAFCNWL